MNNKSRSNLYSTFTNQIIHGGGFPRQSSGNFRPSEASVVIHTKAGPIVEGKCARAVWFRLKGIEKTDDARLPNQIMRMNVGKEVENRCIEDYKKAGVFVANNMPFTQEMLGVKISGELDVILKTKEGEKYLVEEKSIYSYNAQKEMFGRKLIKSAGPGKPRTSYLLQAGIYLYHFSRLDPSDPAYLSFGVIHITDRGDGHYGFYEMELVRESKILPEGGTIPVHRVAYWSEDLEVPYTLTSWTIEDTLGRFRDIQTYLKEDKLPPKDFEKSFSVEKVNRYYKAGLIAENKYKKFMASHGPRGKGKETLGDWNCLKIYCPWSSFCECIKE